MHQGMMGNWGTLRLLPEGEGQSLWSTGQKAAVTAKQLWIKETSMGCTSNTLWSFVYISGFLFYSNFLAEMINPGKNYQEFKTLTLI